MDNHTPVPFGHKMGWLAISSSDRDAVVTALQLVTPVEVTWQTGIDAVYSSSYSMVGILANTSYKVFVSPPVEGWILVVSSWVEGSGGEDGLREIEQLIARLSAQFGEVQAFSTYRVIG